MRMSVFEKKDMITNLSRKSSKPVTEATWSADELRILNECLLKYPETAYTALNRYVKISAHLPGKTIRDIGQKVKAGRTEHAADPVR